MNNYELKDQPIEIQNILELLLLSVPKLTGVLLATTDGLAIAYKLERLDVEQISAMISTNVGLGKRIAASRGIDPMQAVIVQGAGGFLCMYSVGDRHVLAVEASHNANLGIIHIIAQRFALRIANHLTSQTPTLDSTPVLDDPWAVS